MNVSNSEPNDPFGDADEPESMSLSGIAGGGMLPVEDDFVLGGGNPAKAVKQQSILIGAIVGVVAFGAVVTMSYFQPDMTAAAASEETRQWMATLDSRLSNLSQMDKSDPLHPDNVNDLFRDTDALVALMTEDQTRLQVPSEQMALNPFAPLVIEKVEVVDEAALAEAARETKLRAAYDELDAIDVQSILGGSAPRAFINGELHGVGDTVGGFTIEAINPRHIALAYPGLTPRLGERPFRVSIRTDF